MRCRYDINICEFIGLLCYFYSICIYINQYFISKFEKVVCKFKNFVLFQL